MSEFGYVERILKGMGVDKNLFSPISSVCESCGHGVKQIVFPIYSGASMGLSAGCIFYLWKLLPTKNIRVLPLEVDAAGVPPRFERAFKQFVKVRIAVLEGGGGNEITGDFDDMGRALKNNVFRSRLVKRISKKTGNRQPVPIQ